MKIKICSFIMASALGVFLAMPAHAEDSTASTQVAPSKTDAQIDAIDKRIDDKIGDLDNPPESLIASEMAELDALVANANGATPAERASALAYKARVYLNALNQPEKAVATYHKVAEQFPGTKAADGLDAFVAKVERWKRLAAVQAMLVAGVEFPAFTVKDLAGKPLTTAQFRGKPVLIEFWATWCPYCVKQVPDIKAAYEKYHARGFQVVGISRDRTRKALVDYIAKNNMPWPQHYLAEDDPTGKFTERYGIYGIPTTFLLDAQGRIVVKNPKPAELDAALAKLLVQ